ncbi:MAG: M48 family metalloprotease [Desulfobacterales bacterium]|nr:MAG: M48 family metalloprotease [Desulfobacterales bacterium]
MKIYKRIFLVSALLVVLTGISVPTGAEGISIQKEKELSREFLSFVFRYYKVIDAPIIVNYINDLGQKILAAFPPQPFKYHFYVIKDDSLNAFAGPAGHIFVNSGLIQAMKSEEELAGVISHEIAHVSLRHISGKIERSKKTNMVTLAGMVAGVLLGIGGAGDAASAVIMGSTAASQTSALAYSRDDEAEADQVGLKHLNHTGYSAKGLLVVMKKMRSKEWFDSSVIPTYMRTHPAPEERMVNIDIWIAKHEQVQTNFDPYPFQRTRTWLVASYGDKQAALKQFQADITKNRKNSLAHFGYSLILARDGNYDAAIDQMRKALEINAFELYFVIGLGRIYFLAGQYPEALNVLVSLESLAPNHPRRLYYLGRTQMNMGRYHDAIDALEKTIRLYPEYTSAYQYLGVSYGKLDKLSYAHYYLGIYNKRIANLKSADFHLQRALAMMKDPGKRDEIEKMLGEVHLKRAQLRKGSRH